MQFNCTDAVQLFLYFLCMKSVQLPLHVCFIFLPFLALFPLSHPYYLPSLSPLFSITALYPPVFSLLLLTLPSGLSKSFPLDNSLFDSWLAQSVQITADDMLSQWALAAQHGDKSGSLLSDQVGFQKETGKMVPWLLPS